MKSVAVSRAASQKTEARRGEAAGRHPRGPNAWTAPVHGLIAGAVVYGPLLGIVLGALIGAASWGPGPAAAQGADDRPVRREVWDIKLGTKVTDLPDEYVDYACGTNGGPPSTPLTGWKDFRRCRARPSGLREVYFRYDDELEYWAKAGRPGGTVCRHQDLRVPDQRFGADRRRRRGARHPHRVRPARSER